MDGTLFEIDCVVFVCVFNDKEEYVQNQKKCF